VQTALPGLAVTVQHTGQGVPADGDLGLGKETKAWLKEAKHLAYTWHCCAPPAVPCSS
jgi:hypothetical protein